VTVPLILNRGLNRHTERESGQGKPVPYAILIYVLGASTFVSSASGLGKPILCNGWMSLLWETGPNVE